MKKALTLSLILALCFSLASCDPGSFEYDYDVMMETVTSVELITYDNPNAQKVRDGVIADNMIYFDAEKVTVIESLPTEKTEAFMKKLCAWHSTTDNLYDSPINGYNVRITYKDGSFDVLSVGAKFGCAYDASGNPVEIIGDMMHYKSGCLGFFETEFHYPKK